MFKTLSRHLRYTSWPIVAAAVALIAIGISAINVSRRIAGGSGQSPTSQAIYAGIALVVFLVAAVVPYQKLGRAAYGLFAATLVLLVAVLVTARVKGSSRWFDLGLVNFQPSEVAKLTYILMLAWYLRYGDRYRRVRGLIVPFVLSFVPMGLILVEPDLGTALLFLPTLYVMLFMAGARLGHLLLILAMAAVVILLPVPHRVSDEDFAAQQSAFKASSIGPISFLHLDKSSAAARRLDLPVAYCRVRLGTGAVYDIQPLSVRMMRGHQMDRIKGWLRQDNGEVAAREGFQLRWSLVTLAAGRWSGPRTSEKSDGAQGDMFRLALQQLPDERTDFIFSVIGGRWGLLGGLTVLALYGIIFVFGIEIATITDDPFGRLLAVGVVAMLFSQVLINTGMTTGLMPITGMTLPLVSYGGSSLVVSCAALGLLVNVGQSRKIFLARRPFEYGRDKDKQVRMDSAVNLAGKASVKSRRPAAPGRPGDGSQEVPPK